MGPDNFDQVSRFGFENPPYHPPPPFFPLPLVSSSVKPRLPCDYRRLSRGGAAQHTHTNQSPCGRRQGGEAEGEPRFTPGPPGGLASRSECSLCPLGALVPTVCAADALIAHAAKGTRGDLRWAAGFASYATASLG
ncbi:hypothetical protein HPB52_016669 [Rhipicephalus sanguineus]|uniref:Uncharacterized protein n=1 Tax=Rhipicephalus sanguineus TaxID=34632 RepID=A0A9D4SWJ6_RHISA|nr:hypothetical protein HPB52_016669 [Rhipicephalus sanguineus]